MNCFHFSVSLGYTTTEKQEKSKRFLLWIAFIFQYLCDTQQPCSILGRIGSGCELLSFFSIFGIHNNKIYSSINWIYVVNCFHFSVSLGYTTTCESKELNDCKLWIAFIFQYLWDTQQLLPLYFRLPFSCELLSFFSIFGIHNNSIGYILLCRYVVNCFHFSVSLGYTTTGKGLCSFCWTKPSVALPLRIF